MRGKTKEGEKNRNKHNKPEYIHRPIINVTKEIG